MKNYPTPCLDHQLSENIQIASIMETLGTQTYATIQVLDNIINGAEELESAMPMESYSNLLGLLDYAHTLLCRANALLTHEHHDVTQEIQFLEFTHK